MAMTQVSSDQAMQSPNYGFRGQLPVYSLPAIHLTQMTHRPMPRMSIG